MMANTPEVAMSVPTGTLKTLSITDQGGR